MEKRLRDLEVGDTYFDVFYDEIVFNVVWRKEAKPLLHDQVRIISVDNGIIDEWRGNVNDFYEPLEDAFKESYKRKMIKNIWERRNELKDQIEKELWDEYDSFINKFTKRVFERQEKLNNIENYG